MKTIISRLFAPAMLLYVGAVVAVNIGFSYIPPIPTPLGVFAPMALLVGFIFIIRDFAQRAAGHSVIVAMIAATAISYLLADPHVALASASAFAVSELVDWAVYTFTQKPFHKRVIYSSLISAPVDTAVFLFGIGFMSLGTFILMVLSKLVAVGVIWMMRPQETIREPAWDV